MQRRARHWRWRSTSRNMPAPLLATANGGVNAGPFLSAAAPTALRQARKIFAIRTSPVATDNQIRAGADAAMGYPRFGMLDLLKLLSGLLVGLFRSHAARE